MWSCNFSVEVWKWGISNSKFEFCSVNFLLIIIDKCSSNSQDSIDTNIRENIYYNFIKTFRSVQSSLQETSTCRFLREKLVSTLGVTFWMSMSWWWVWVDESDVESLFPEEAISLDFLIQNHRIVLWPCIGSEIQTREIQEEEEEQTSICHFSHLTSRSNMVAVTTQETFTCISKE